MAVQIRILDRGGFAVILEQEDGTGKPVVLGREDNSTNIRMEGWALVAAMRGAKGRECEIHTDSQFWVNVITKWMEGWKANEWHKVADAKRDQDGNFVEWKESSIKNLDIVKELDRVYNPEKMKLVWVRGHVGTKLNEMADTWANKARKGEKLAL